jgi:hypothetical protein
MLLLSTGCHRRQTASRLVYVSPPPSAGAPDIVLATDSIVIAEPEPPEDEVQTTDATGPEPETTPKRTVRHRRSGAIRADSPAEAEEQPASPPAPAPAGVPALEPQESPEKMARLRREVSTAQEDTLKRLTQLDRMALGPGDRKTLDDARAFLSQAARELEKGELMRSMNLVRKAALLVSAVEQSH